MVGAAAGPTLERAAYRLEVEQTRAHAMVCPPDDRDMTLTNGVYSFSLRFRYGEGVCSCC